MAKADRKVIGGVDTHADTHCVAVLDSAGRLLGTREFPSDRAGCEQLLAWLRRHGQLSAVGVEGCGSYGAGLMRLLTERRVPVLEVDRPNRQDRRRRGKSDPLDAEAAARAVLSGVADGTPKSRDGVVEAIRALRVVRSGAVKSRTAALNTLISLARTAPEPLAGQLRGHSARRLVSTTVRFRLPVPAADSAARAAQLDDPVTATKLALRRLAQRVQAFDAEITAADQDLHALLTTTAPDLLARHGVGIDTAGQLLVTAGDNPERLADDRAFAALTGTSPLPASSGRTDRHRLNRGGDRAANRALFSIALSRMATHQPTRDYVERRTKDGLSKREIMRCLKRYIARELFPLIVAALNPPDPQTTLPAAA
jgi:transposase